MNFISAKSTEIKFPSYTQYSMNEQESSSKMYGVNSEKVDGSILLIEDNPGDARLVQILLEEANASYNISNKVSLSEGIQALSEQPFDVILLDLTLPDSRGLITLEKLIQHSPEANIIVLTGFSDKQMGIQAVELGAQDFLIKGDFDGEQLAKTLRYSIQRNSVLSRLEEAQRIAHIGSWDFQTETSIFSVSDETYRIFGYVPKETTLSLALIKEHIIEEDKPIVRQVFTAIEKTGEAHYDFRIIRKDGSLRYISVRGKRSAYTHKCSGVIQDITTRKEAEEKLIKSQNQFQNIFTQSKDAIFTITETGQFIHFNEATSKLFGYSNEELQSLNINALYKTKSCEDLLSEAVKTASKNKDVEVEMTSKYGDVINCLISASVFEADNTKIYNIMLRDITGRKQAEELRKGKEIAEKSAALKEKFLANVSHEMRTPMNAILGMTNLISRDNLNDEQVNYLDSITQSSQHLLGIINDILEITLIEQEGKINLKHEKFNLKKLLTNLVEIYKYKTKEKKVELILQIEDPLDEFVIGDALRLNQILTNLVGNAIKFTEQGHVKIKVKQENINNQKAKFTFIVEDTGIGIPKDKFNDIFKTFVRIRSAENEQYPGTGLGLSIAKQLVNAHNGIISVESKENQGSTFSVTIDLERNATSLQPNHNEDTTIALDATRCVRILLAEDHKLNQIVAKRTLEKEFDNIEITIAENGKIAVNLMEQNDYDIILMDIQMPIMTGDQAAKIIRQMPAPKCNIPILAMTAHIHVAQDEKYKEYGMNDYVLKPFEPKNLFQKIAYYVNATTTVTMINEEKPDQLKYIDLSYMDLMSDGDVEMKKMMLELLFVEPALEVKKMSLLAQANNLSNLSAVSHKMKSTLAFVGNEELTKTNKQIEQIAKSGENANELPALINSLDTLFGKALAEIKYVHSTL